MWGYTAPQASESTGDDFLHIYCGGAVLEGNGYHDTQIHYGYGLIWAGRAARITSHLQSLLQDVQISEKVPGVETERDLCII